MKTAYLISEESEAKTGARVGNLPPNIFEESYLEDGGELLGFYLPDVERHSTKLKKLFEVANAELLSKRVPKSLLERSDVFSAVYRDGLTRKQAKATKTVQYSTIIGSIPAKPHMRRPYHNRSSVHSVESARAFVKAMRLAADELRELMGKLAPELASKQLGAMERIPEEWRFGELFTSSISNYNISAPIHIDKGNVLPSYNCIYTARANSRGGCLYVPDYEAVFEQPHGSLLVYPAWRNKHGVTDIEQTHDNGYRNSLIFYALKAFAEKGGKEDEPS